MNVDDPREANEERLIASIERVMREKLEKDWSPAETRRDAHAKHTGLLEGRFTVETGLPPELRVGLFAEPRTYQAWIRTSSASGTPRADHHKDLRGLAIKLLEVPGQKLPESDEPRSQDFVLLSYPSMPLGTLKLFHDAIYYGLKWSIAIFALKMLLTGRKRILTELAQARINPPSPLEIRYWSTTPYQFGKDKVVKYSLLPTSGTPTVLPATLTDQYLTEAMERRLGGGDVTFDFAVQFRAPDMSIADSGPRWSETVSPFIKVATLTIPRQVFRTEERTQLAEALAFSPGHALLEHRPLGSINRARMHVYRANSAFRRHRRGLPLPHRS